MTFLALAFIAMLEIKPPAPLPQVIVDGRLSIRSEFLTHGRYWDGGIQATIQGDEIELHATRHKFRDWQTIVFRVEQSRSGVHAHTQYRTPADRPDFMADYYEPNLTLLVIRHMELRWILDSVLDDAGLQRFAFDPVTAAYIDPSIKANPAVSQAVEYILPSLASEVLQDRRWAHAALVGLGSAGGVALRRIPRHALTVEQNRGVDEVLAQYPALTEEDLVAARFQSLSRCNYRH